MPRILVADDNSNIQKMVTLALKDQGIEVVAVGNGEAAVRKLSEQHPDLILADIFMPVRNGYEVCEYVKHDPRFAHIPVILLVGAFDPLDEREAQRVGADGVLKKPFVPPDPLIAMVKSVLARSTSAPLAPVGVSAERSAPAQAEAAALAAYEPPVEAVHEEFAVSPGKVEFGEGEKPLAFGELLETPTVHAEPEPQPAPLRDTGLGEMRFWQSAAGVEEPASEPVTPEWSPAEPTVSLHDEAPAAPEVVEVEPAEGPSAEAATHVELGPPPDLAASAAEWMETAPTHPPVALPTEASETWDNAAPVAAPPATQPDAPASLAVHGDQAAPGVESVPEAAASAAQSVPSAETREPESRLPRATEAYTWHESAEVSPAEWTEPLAAPELPSPVSHEPAESPAASTAWASPPAPPIAEPEPIGGQPAQSFEVLSPPNPELVEAVVTKVLERMQPQILEVVTREILKPVVEALVRRELEKP